MLVHLNMGTNVDVCTNVKWFIYLAEWRRRIRSVTL